MSDRVSREKSQTSIQINRSSKEAKGAGKGNGRAKNGMNRHGHSVANGFTTPLAPAKLQPTKADGAKSAAGDATLGPGARLSNAHKTLVKTHAALAELESALAILTPDVRQAKNQVEELRQHRNRLREQLAESKRQYHDAKRRYEELQKKFQREHAKAQDARRLAAMREFAHRHRKNELDYYKKVLSHPLLLPLHALVRRGWVKQRSRQARLIANSGLFDRDWYITRHPEARKDPVTHYLRDGALSGAEPNPDFDTAWYLENHPEARRQGLNPLLHYIQHGAANGEPTRPPEPEPQVQAMNQAVPALAMEARAPLPAPNVVPASGEQATEYDAVAEEPDTFVLYRIIGNDLPPRHRKGQALENVRFILENEPPLPNCEKRWVVNRIVDPEMEKQIIALLDEHGQQYIRIPFVEEEYKKVTWSFYRLPEVGYLYSEEYMSLGPNRTARVLDSVYHDKNLYAMNNNGARNVALRAGRSLAKWVLPWDGNCFVTKQAWADIQRGAQAAKHKKYLSVPMARVTDNAELLQSGALPEAVEEPQIIFRRDAREEFDESMRYGRRPKVALFYRLGIPGKWDTWKIEPWDREDRSPSPEYGQFAEAGWVARLFSGQKELELANEASFRDRGLARMESVRTLINRLDEGIASKFYTPDKLLIFNQEALERNRRKWQSKDRDIASIVEHLIANAEAALGRGPHSVIDKTTLPPSKDPHDYWHPAPYWWPNPETSDGLPYIKKDGERIPGTEMYEPESRQYDRTRAQRLFDDTHALALATYFTGRREYAEHGAKLVRTWFVAPQTRMNPHLRYAQVRMGHNKNEGLSSGIIEFKDMYYFLDAVRLLRRAEALTEADRQGLSQWLSEYLDWLLRSKQGQRECRALNNHGVLYDLQVASIAGYLGKLRLVLDTLMRSQSRIEQHFALDGSQPHEMERTLTQHYCTFNLQSWANLATLASSIGVDLWNYETDDGRGLKRAFEWLLQQPVEGWPYPQLKPFDAERMIPLKMAAQRRYGVNKLNKHSSRQFTPVFNPHDGIQPYWILSS